ncbi:phytanoyl-CoA dioxygenase family protein [Klebsiella michiganensis]|uniref:Phytanoyl-CoA dioxygenase family protein n=1 Tax=Klebsiella michiganensis TaxID=1134687 RepID=A0A7H4N008_9ENTR|nr:phytanoyl-CoA dioxygenase family protein [Klebsiella michiganensis]
MIAQWQIEQFHQQGFLVVEEVLSAEEVALLQADFDAWVEESRQHSEVWGRNPGRSAAFRPRKRPRAPIIRRCAV